MCDNKPRLSDAIDIVLVFHGRVGVVRLSTECLSFFAYLPDYVPKEGRS